MASLLVELKTLFFCDYARTMHELRNWNALVISPVKCKQLLFFEYGQGQKSKQNKQQRTLSDFITIHLYQGLLTIVRCRELSNDTGKASRHSWHDVITCISYFGAWKVSRRFSGWILLLHPLPRDLEITMRKWVIVPSKAVTILKLALFLSPESFLAENRSRRSWIIVMNPSGEVGVYYFR